MPKTNNICDTIHLWMKEPMLKEGLTEFETEVAGTSENGAGYIGEVRFVKVIGKTANGELKEFHYVIKSGKNNEQLRKEVPFNEAYETETAIYNKVVPEYRKFQSEWSIMNTFNNIPRCISTLNFEGIEILILDNLNELGFSLCDKNEPLDLDHLKLIWEAYGKWHAISFALQENNIALFQDLHSRLSDVFKLFVGKKLLNNVIEDVRNTYEFFEDDEDILHRYRNLEAQIPYVFQELISQPDPHQVIIHGDCWSNNFMFKYQDNEKSKPVDVRILDWQNSTLGSPVRDLSYNLFVCASKKELDHLDELLHVYHGSLSNVLLQFALDPDKIFSFETLMKQWRKYSIWGFFAGIFVLKFALCDQDDAPDFGELAKDGNMKDMTKFAVKDKTKYKQRVRDVVYHYAERGLM